jgi:hypothetical protein
VHFLNVCALLILLSTNQGVFLIPLLANIPWHCIIFFFFFFCAWNYVVTQNHWNIICFVILSDPHSARKTCN